METWSAHHLFQKTSSSLGVETALEIQQYVNQLRASNLPVIFSLGHLSKITQIEYDLLRDTVNRRRESANYDMFTIKKRSGKCRFIHAVNGKLFDLQKYLNNHVLQKTVPHPASFAFHPSGGIRKCASVHCGCRWLLQFDLKDFFYSIAEPKVFATFKNLGYKPLLAFELSRLCTTLRLPSKMNKYLRCSDKYRSDEFWDERFDKEVIRKPYPLQEYIGVLPQGAPTSPMLSNLIAEKLDVQLSDYGQQYGFVYTRYADDIALSASELPRNKSIGCIQREVISIIRKTGFTENKKKIRVAGPGSKKLILGLLVDGKQPRISKEMLRRIDRNLYAVNKFGLVATSEYEGFDSAYGFYNHISGLISFIKDVDFERWENFQSSFDSIEVPFES